MAVTISGTNGIAVPLGTAAAPGVVNTTSATTGIYNPTSTTLGLSTNGTNAVYIDASQNVGIGTSTFNGVKTVIQGAQTGGVPQTSGTTQTYGLLRLKGTTFTSVLDFGTNGGTYNWIQATDSANLATNYDLAIQPNGGNLLVGTTATNPISSRVNGVATGPIGFITSRATSNMACGLSTTSGTNIQFYTDNGSTYVTAGNIGSNGSTTSFNSSSDYRLKENVTEFENGLLAVMQMRPVSFAWKEGYGEGVADGFIAHELAEIVPYAVAGEKDAVNEDGTIKPQGVDYSKIVVHLVAAIQELSAEVEALKAKVGA